MLTTQIELAAQVSDLLALDQDRMILLLAEQRLRRDHLSSDIELLHKTKLLYMLVEIEAEDAESKRDNEEHGRDKSENYRRTIRTDRTDDDKLGLNLRLEAVRDDPVEVLAKRITLPVRLARKVLHRSKRAFNKNVECYLLTVVLDFEVLLGPLEIIKLIRVVFHAPYLAAAWHACTTAGRQLRKSFRCDSSTFFLGSQRIFRPRYQHIFDLRTIKMCDIMILIHMTPETKAPGFWAETFRFVIISVVIILPIRLFVAQPFIVSGASMSPTFENGEYLIVDELSYHLHGPARGDVTIFRYPAEPSTFFIKRVIGLPGETVTIHGSTVEITETNGSHVTLNEPYIKFPSQNEGTKTLGKDEYFMMGDNRAESFDSRSWGPLPAKDLVGRAMLRLFPFSKAGANPGSADPAK